MGRLGCRLNRNEFAANGPDMLDACQVLQRSRRRVPRQMVVPRRSRTRHHSARAKDVRSATPRAVLWFRPDLVRSMLLYPIATRLLRSSQRSGTRAYCGDTKRHRSNKGQENLEGRPGCWLAPPECLKLAPDPSASRNGAAQGRADKQMPAPSQPNQNRDAAARTKRRGPQPAGGVVTRVKKYPARRGKPEGERSGEQITKWMQLAPNPFARNGSG
jgi:hypothetical protein